MATSPDFRRKLSRARARGGATERLHVPDCTLLELQHELESDRGRIINSAAVRRLQQKTQVFPLERNAAVRSRLTHSLEVQQTGRYIVRSLFQQLGDRATDCGLQGMEDALESLVEMACLTHDIGNPPFGHFGEFAIGDWFARKLDGLMPAASSEGQGDAEMAARMRRDLVSFEGNAQAIRLVTRLLRLNLTYVQTAGLLKYVRAADQPRPVAGTPGAYLNKKPGFYLSEAPLVDAMCKALGMAPGTRHPIVYIMEAADDIAYCLADIEDAVEKGIFGIDALAELLVDRFARLASPDLVVPGAGSSFRTLIGETLERARSDEINRIGEFFISLRVKLIHPLVQHAAGQFIRHLDQVSAGTLDRALMEDASLPHAIVQTLKDVAAEFVFSHREVETLQLQGFRILQGLLDFHEPLLQLPADAFVELTEGKGHPQQLMLVRRMPSHLIKAYREAVAEAAPAPAAPHWEFYHRCRLLQDLVSGMTDQHAQDEYRTLSAH